MVLKYSHSLPSRWDIIAVIPQQVVSEPRLFLVCSVVAIYFDPPHQKRITLVFWLKLLKINLYTKWWMA